MSNLRPEAHSCSFEQLTTTEQLAFHEVLGQLSASVDAMDAGANQGDDLKWAYNQVTFLHGRRGSGKTTVLKSLRRAFLRGQPLPDSRHSTHEQLRQLQPRLIWLEPLDLEPLDWSNNLLATVLIRIEEALQPILSGVDAPRTAGPVDSRASWWTGTSGLPDALDRLRRLQTDVALAWPSNLPSRQSALDADTYAVEVLREERARLGLPRAFHEVLTELAQQLGRTREYQNPIFLLPVDDFDLNPFHALNLLRFLRMVVTPRLRLLVAGDIQLLEQLIHLKVHRQLAEALQPESLKDMTSLADGELAGLITAVSSSNLRKLIPPGHQVKLPDPELAEVLKYPPDQQSPKLLELLHRLPVVVNTARPADQPETGQRIGGRWVRTLADFLLLPQLSTGFSQATHHAAERHAAIYSGVAILNRALRKIADLHTQLSTLAARYEEEQRAALQSIGATGGVAAEVANRKLEQDAHGRLIDLAAQELQSALREDPRLAPALRNDLLTAVSPDRYQEWRLDTSRFQAEEQTATGPRLELELEGSSLKGYLRTASHAEWHVRPSAATTSAIPGRPRPRPAVPPLPLLSEESSAWLRVLHDLIPVSTNPRGMGWGSACSGRCSASAPCSIATWSSDHSHRACSGSPGPMRASARPAAP